MISAFSRADTIPHPFGGLATAFHFREALYPTLAPDLAAAYGQMHKLQLELFGYALKLWLLPLSAVHDAPDAPDAVSERAVAAEAVAVPAPPMPAPLRASEQATDDLQRINGIGPKLQRTLNGLGILRFEQIAALSPEDVTKLNETIGFKGRIERESWLAQASRLSKTASPRQAA